MLSLSILVSSHPCVNSQGKSGQNGRIGEGGVSVTQEVLRCYSADLTASLGLISVHRGANILFCGRVYLSLQSATAPQLHFHPNRLASAQRTRQLGNHDAARGVAITERSSLSRGHGNLVRRLSARIV